MKSFRDRLLSTTVIPAVFGAGIAIVGGTFIVCGARAGRPAAENPAALPKAQPRSEIIELAACNPCGAASESAEISPAEATAVYDCLKPEMAAAYAKAGMAQVAGFTGWINVATSPYQSGTHGGRYVNNYADPHGDYRYKMYEKAGTLPLGSVLAKDSFVVRPDGKVAVGPLFVMEKMDSDFNKSTGNWRYTMIMPNCQVAGRTGAKGMSMKFCADCHSSVAPEQDHIMLLPEEFRKSF